VYLKAGVHPATSYDRKPYHSGTKRRVRVVTTPALYSGGPGFKSQYGDWLTDVFRGFPQFLLANAGIVPSKLGYDRFLPNPFQFIIHLPPFHSTLCNLSSEKASLYKLLLQINKPIIRRNQCSTSQYLRRRVALCNRVQLFAHSFTQACFYTVQATVFCSSRSYIISPEWDLEGQL
jgi:hypothetical protein